jgi:ribosomal protein L11 methyltransferase
MPNAISYWLEISVNVDGEAAEAVAAAIEQYAHKGRVFIELLGDPNDPDPRALLDELYVKIYVPDYQDTPLLRRKIDEAMYYLGRLYPIPEPRYSKILDEDWSTAWRKNYKPFRIGERTWIQPSWLDANELAENDLVITLDPGMAFGTGMHPSTQMCIEAMEAVIQPDCSLLDVGTGSGILAIAGVGFGATKVLAFDSDGVAVRTARDNVRLNYVSESIELFQGTLKNVGPSTWDVVAVNILAPIINSLLRAGLLDYLAPGGRLILSGIIDDQVDELKDTISGVGGEIIRKIVTKDWVALVVKHKAPYPK